MAGNVKNLKRGNLVNNKGRSKEARKEAEEVRKISKKLITDKVYQAKLIEKLQDGTLHPSMQAMLWYFAFGKPMETQDEKTPVPVRLEMVLHPDATDETTPK